MEFRLLACMKQKCPARLAVPLRGGPCDSPKSTIILHCYAFLLPRTPHASLQRGGLQPVRASEAAPGACRCC